MPRRRWLIVPGLAALGLLASAAYAVAGDLQSSGRSAAKFVGAQVSTLRRAVTSLSRARATLLAKAAALPLNSPRRAADEARLTWDHGVLRGFDRQIEAATGELTHTSSGSIVAVAAAPGKPGGPSKLPVLLGGSVAGLLAGVIAAFVLGRRDKRIHGTPAT